jgi:protein-L-isoaspartate(D-aspartate) O-methyltransferase
MFSRFNRDQNRDDGLRRMLKDIEYEVHLTRTAIGKDTLNPRVLQVMGQIPRHELMPEAIRYAAYDNGPAGIGYGQTISQPYIVALMTDLLDPQEGDEILEIGTGSGYQAAVLSRIVKQVYSIEIIPELAQTAADRLRALGYDNVEVKIGDGYRGWPEHSPFDGIIVTAAAPHIPPPLIKQLRPGGRLVIPVGQPYRHQELMVVKKNMEGGTEARDVLAVAFVPLTGALGPPPGDS